ncbi:hypothetical protein ACIBI9_05630 [Nonomuraea sp. NPDC050451]|uniref:hypothetical protein n=1 Tax=Nonomuraea sp. NPDC050451 TaxID=3364364 RepID=UPI0037A878DA
MPLPLEHPLLDGALVLPGDPGWDAARSACQLTVDQRPAALVLARTAGDVATTLEAARTAGLRVAPQGSGHNATTDRPATSGGVWRRSWPMSPPHTVGDERYGRRRVNAARAARRPPVR